MQNEFGRFDHTGKVFCKSNWQITKNILDGSIAQKISPIMTIDLTNACNYNCDFCIDRAIVSGKANKEINWDTLSTLITQAREKGCHCLEISGGGEPTLYSHFNEFIALASQLEYRLALITNGSMLKKYADVLRDAPFDWIRISLDSSCAATHSLVHKTKVNYYNDVLSGIEKLVDYHTIGISFLITDDNTNEIFIAAQKAKQLHVKYFEVKPLTHNYKSTIHNDDTKIATVQEQLSLAMELEDENFKVFCPSSLHDWMNRQDDYQKEYPKCLAAYYRSVVTPSGVYICPNHRGNNVNECVPSTADEIIDFRNREIDFIDPRKDCCSFCARAAINTLLYSIINSTNYNPAILNYFGWPVDYGEDAVWI